MTEKTNCVEEALKINQSFRVLWVSVQLVSHLIIALNQTYTQTDMHIHIHTNIHTHIPNSTYRQTHKNLGTERSACTSKLTHYSQLCPSHR